MPQDKTTKAQRRDAARIAAAAQREAQAKRDKRNRLIAILILVVGVLALAGAVYWILDYGKPKPLAEVSSPATATADGGLTFGSDLTAGTVNDGAVDVTVYLDYSCPACQQFETLNADILKGLAADGDITLTMHPIAILAPKISTTAAAATGYIADKSPEHTLEFITATITAVEEGDVTDAQLTQIAENVGVPSDVAAKATDGTFTKWVEAATREAVSNPDLDSGSGFGTPTILVDGQILADWRTAGNLEAAIAAAAAS